MDNRKREKLTKLLEGHAVKIAYLFGSQKENGVAFLGGGNFTMDEMSDLDMGLVFEKPPMDPFGVYGEIYAALSLLFEPFHIDLVFLQETDVLFRYEAMKGELLYCKDENFLDEYEELTMKLAADLSFKKVEFGRDFIEAIKDGYFEITLRQN